KARFPEACARRQRENGEETGGEIPESVEMLGLRQREFRIGEGEDRQRRDGGAEQQEGGAAPPGEPGSGGRGGGGLGNDEAFSAEEAHAAFGFRVSRGRIFETA